MKYIFFLLMAIILGAGCHTISYRKDREKFEASAVKERYRNISNMNDVYFEIKENNFFRFYRLLYDSVPNSQYTGRYTMRGDTMVLQYHNRKGSAEIGSKAFIDKASSEVIFFDDALKSRSRWVLFR